MKKKASVFSRTIKTATSCSKCGQSIRIGRSGVAAPGGDLCDKCAGSNRVDGIITNWDWLK